MHFAGATPGLVLRLANRTTSRSSLKIPLVVFSYLYESFSVNIQIHGKVGAVLLVGRKRKMTVSTRSLGTSYLYSMCLCDGRCGDIDGLLWQLGYLYRLQTNKLAECIWNLWGFRELTLLKTFLPQQDEFKDSLNRNLGVVFHEFKFVPVTFLRFSQKRFAPNKLHRPLKNSKFLNLVEVLHCYWSDNCV